MKLLPMLSICLCLALLAGCVPTASRPQEPTLFAVPDGPAPWNGELLPTQEPTPEAEPTLSIVVGDPWSWGSEPQPTPEPTPFLPAAGAAVPLSARLVTIPAVEPARTDGGQEGYAAFGAELLRRCRTEGKNTLVSPLSVVLALGMTANGADGDTLAEFETLFGADLDTLNGLCAAMLADYSSLGGSTEANLVNSLWADPDLAPEDAFIARCQQTFGAEVFDLDLQDAATVNAVNAWVNNATRGMIPQIVDRFDPDAVLALINAVYLKNKFESPFETPTHEWTLTFTAADGSVTEPYGMSNGTRYERYIAAENGQGVVLPYDDGRLGLLLMLPDEGLSMADYLSAWDGATVKALLDSAQEMKVNLTMPKFKTEWSNSLKDTLQRMGLAAAFDDDRANFSPMGQTVDGRPLYIGDVIHKTAFEINEKGTEAAAVTAVIMYGVTSVREPEMVIQLRLDRPFVYGIVDLETGTPLFLGTAESIPSAQ